MRALSLTIMKSGGRHDKSKSIHFSIPEISTRFSRLFTTPYNSLSASKQSPLPCCHARRVILMRALAHHGRRLPTSRCCNTLRSTPSRLSNMSTA